MGHLEGLALVVAALTNVAAEDLRGRDKTRRASSARQLFSYVARRRTTKTLREIGEFLDGRDHATIKTAVDAWEDLVMTNSKALALTRQALKAPLEDTEAHQ